MKNDTRSKFLEGWAESIAQSARSGVLDKGRPITIHSIEMVCGPRAGVLECHAGLDTGRMLVALSANDFALHRQFIPWNFGGEPSVFLNSRYVRLEAAWPDSLSDCDIKLSSLSQRPRPANKTQKSGVHWVAGKSENGATVTLHIGDDLPHYLFGGWTGSGKTWAMRSAVAQLSRETGNQVILIDGKFGEGLGCLSHLPGIVGPMATDVDSARSALSWAVTEMKRRYATADKRGRLIVVIDEIQEFTGRSGDALVIELVRRLVSQGRGAGVHLLIGTQHPVGPAFSDSSIRRNLAGRLALRTEDYKASEVVIGKAWPRADRLLGKGDAYIVTPAACHRAQLAYIPPVELEAMNTSSPIQSIWPEPDAEVLGNLPEPQQTKWSFGGDELAATLVAVSKDDNAGRGAVQSELEQAGLGKPGSGRADKLLVLGRDMRTWLVVNDYCLPARSEDVHPAGYEVGQNGLVVSTPWDRAGRQAGDAKAA